MVLNLENILGCAVIKVIGSRWMRLTGPVARMGGTRYIIYTKMLTREPEGKKVTWDRIEV